MQNNTGKQIAALKAIEKILRILPSRRNRIISLVVLAAVPVFVLLVGFRILNSRQATAKVEAQNAQIRAQTEQYKTQNEQYLAVLESDDPEVFNDYVVRVAREQLGLSLPGDQVFIDRSLFKSTQQ